MPVCALTSVLLRTLDALIPSEKAVMYVDTEIKGFVLEHRSSGSGTFLFRYRSREGKQCRIRIGKLYEMTLREAQTKAFLLRDCLDAGGDPKLKQHLLDTVPTLQQFAAEYYMPYAKSRKRSWSTDEALLRVHLLPRFGDTKIDRIVRSEVSSMHIESRKQYAAGTCNRILILFRYMLNCAIRWEMLPAGSNPCVGVELFPDNGARERYLTQQEARLLLNELDANPNTQVAQIIKLLLYTGARKREILDARWEHVDFARRLLTVPLSKSGKPRHIPLSDVAMQLLRDLPHLEGVPWVFVNPKTGKPPVSFFHAWDSIRAKVGLSGVRLHDLRHSFASFLVNAGCSLYEVQALLGHHDPKVTMRYAHLAPGALIAAANTVGMAVRGQERRERRERRERQN
ncbi:MAG: site-specific integrase [Bilophila sp.]